MKGISNPPPSAQVFISTIWSRELRTLIYIILGVSAVVHVISSPRRNNSCSQVLAPGEGDTTQSKALNESLTGKIKGDLEATHKIDCSAGPIIPLKASYGIIITPCATIWQTTAHIEWLRFSKTWKIQVRKQSRKQVNFQQVHQDWTQIYRKSNTIGLQLQVSIKYRYLTVSFLTFSHLLFSPWMSIFRPFSAAQDSPGTSQCLCVSKSHILRRRYFSPLIRINSCSYSSSNGVFFWPVPRW